MFEGELLDSAHALEEAKNQCELIPHVVTGGKKVPFLWREGKGWFWSAKEGPHGTITGDLKDIREKGVEYGESVTLHESLHVRLDDLEQFTKEEWNTPGFAIGLNWMADNRIENAAHHYLNAGDEVISYHLAEEVKPGGGLDFSKNASSGVTGGIKDTLNYIPKHMVYGAAARQYFYYKELMGTITTQQDVDNFLDKVKAVDEEVAEVLKKTLPAIEDFYHTLPGPFSTREQELAKAHEMGQKYRDIIWPEYKKLVEQAYDEHAMNDFIKELIEGGQFSGQSSGGQIIIVDISSLPEDVQQEIKDKISQKQKQTSQSQQGDGNQESQEQGSQNGQGMPSGMGGSGGQFGEQQESQNGEETQSGSGESTGQSEGKIGQELTSESGEQGTSETEAGEAKDGTSKTNESESPSDANTSSNDTSVTMDELSEKAKDAVKQAWEQVSKEEKDEVKKKAASELGAAEDEVNKQIQGHTDDEKISRPSEVAKKIQENSGQENSRDADQSDKNDDRLQTNPQKDTSQSSEQNQGNVTASTEYFKPTEQDIQDIDRFNADFLRTLDKEKNDYERALQMPIVNNAIDTLIGRLEPLFNPNIKPKRKHSSSGLKLDIKKEIRAEMNEDLTTELFVTEGKKESQDYRFVTLVDLSGSMNNKRNEMFQFLVIQTNVLSYLGIDNAVLGFTDDGVGFSGGRIVRYFKQFESTEGFGSSLKEDAMKEFSKIRTYGGGGTPTSSAMSATYEHVILQRHQEVNATKKTRTFFIVITDGQPTEADFSKGLTAEQTALRTIEEIKEYAQSSQMNLVVLGLGIGPGTEFVQNIFPALPDDLKVIIAEELSQIKGKHIDPQEVVGSFDNAEDLVLVYPLIIEYLINNPEGFE